MFAELIKYGLAVQVAAGAFLAPALGLAAWVWSEAERFKRK